MTYGSSSRRKLVIAAFIGGMLTYGASYLIAGNSDPDQKIALLESRIEGLEASLATAQNELKNTRWSSDASNLAANGKAAEIPKRVKDSGTACSDSTVVNNVNSVEILRNLEISPPNDSRSFVERVNGILADNPPKEKIAVATKAIFDMARDRDHLPDDALQTMYHNQSDPDLKRVAAQVLAQRGNDTLLEDQVAKAQVKLKSTHAKDRQDALVQLAKLRNIKAADAIVPLLHDPDTDVRLDALLALRNNGNALNVGYVEMLRSDPSPAVRSLANDVASDLKDLSASARTSMSASDIEAGLPPM
ncbi:MAG TPA: HEAT repeat domain-containing protein [Steroidobacteraceae bacterium]|nr:HEAT repeat domain-containing protein [Steroidobacteraceae bacterium]